MSVSQRVTQNQCFIYLRKGKEKTDMELLEEILSQNNLNKAYKKVVANKGVAGVDGITVEEEFDYIKENKDRIINQIRKRKYKTQPELGVPFEIAFNCANTRKGYYQICKTRYIQFAINNERLRKRGLVFLLDQYEKVHI